MIVDGRECATGIDVSEYQGQIDWVRAKPHISFAYIKATEGTGWIDPRAYGNYAGALAAGVPFGAYHFARPSGDLYDADAEARWFYDHFKGSGWTLPPALDLETSGIATDKTDDWALGFCRELKRLCGEDPIIYTGAYFPMERNPDLANYALWLPAYTANYSPDPDPTKMPPPPSCAPWGRAWSIWQYTSSGHVPGVGGVSVDMNVATVGWLTRAIGQPPTNPPSEATMLIAIVGFLDKPDRWLFGVDRDGYFFWKMPGERDLLEFEGKLPFRQLAGGDDWLDARFHEGTGL